MKQMFFWNSLAFLMIQQMLVIWSLVSHSSLNIWNFMVHVLLKPGLENFEHFFTSTRDECNCAIGKSVHILGIIFLRDWKEKWIFQPCGHCRTFQICWHIECSTFTASSSKTGNSSTGIPSPPLALFIVILPTCLTLHSRMPGSRWVFTPSWLSGSLKSFFV